MEVLTGEMGLERPVTVWDIHRPGLELAGFTKFYPSERIQIFGWTEMGYLEQLSEAECRERVSQLCRENTPCFCITRNLNVPPVFKSVCEEKGVPILRTVMLPSQVFTKLTNYLVLHLSPKTAIHGVLVDVAGVGVLITGSSGIGKSETALELVKRGHRLVADDVVEIHRSADNELIGNAPELIRYLLEIRGLGIINVMTLFGAGAVRTHKKIVLCIRLESWDEGKSYDRLGLDVEYMTILDERLPLVTIPVRPGRNLAVIVEVAAMNHRLKRMGLNAAVDLSNKLMDMIDHD
jgi:HPr kinase/phosphorylase